MKEYFKLNELFKSLQGEGYNLGREVVFVRLSNCNLSCEWCDTDFKDFSVVELDNLVQAIENLNCKSVILTGGEPTMHNLEPLVKALKELGYWIGIETNGTNSIQHLEELIDYIAISPKGKTNQFKANEVRVVNDLKTVQDLLEVEKCIEAINYFISPLEQNGKFNYTESLQLLSVINRVSEHKWMMSFQVHKLAGIR